MNLLPTRTVKEPRGWNLKLLVSSAEGSEMPIPGPEGEERVRQSGVLRPA